MSIAACTGLKNPVDRSRADASDSGSGGSSGVDGESGSSGASSDSSVAGSGGESGGDAESGGQSGGTDTSGQAGAGGNAGSTGGVGAAGTGSIDMDAATGEDAATDAGPDAEGGAMLPSIHVEGKVIDYFRNPVPETLVTLNGSTAMTDAEGTFVFDDVTPPYSVSISMTIARLGATELAGYLFVGLTRDDPTLQVYHGLPRRSGYVNRGVENVPFPMAPDEEIQMDFATAFGGFDAELDDDTVRKSGEWEGPQVVAGTAHALRFTYSTTSPQLPTSYLAHDSEPLAVDSTMDSTVSFDLGSTGTLTDGLISGTATSSGAGSRENMVFVRFLDDAAVEVVDHVNPAEAFSYLVPSLPGASITLAAMRSSPTYPPWGVAYLDGLTPGASGIAMAIPPSATLISPASGTSNVDEDTVFRWNGPDMVYMFVAKAVGYSETYYVITADLEASLPISHVTAPAFRPDAPYLWSVRTHRMFSSVDDAAGSTGYLDAYCYGRLRGPHRGSSMHTESTLNGFTSAP